MPERLHQRVYDVISSEELYAFFQTHYAILIGLTALIVVMLWSARRLTGWTGSEFSSLEARAGSRAVRGLLSIGRLLAAHLSLIGLLLWCWLALWILGLLGSPAGRIILYFAGTSAALLFGFRLVQKTFNGERAGGLMAPG